MMYEWKITWRRHGWRSEQSRHFQTKTGAEALVRRLEGDDPRYRHLSEPEYIVMEKRDVGEWEHRDE